MWRATPVDTFHCSGDSAVDMEILKWFNNRNAMLGLPKQNRAGRTPSEPGRQEELVTATAFSISLCNASDDCFKSSSQKVKSPQNCRKKCDVFEAQLLETTKCQVSFGFSDSHHSCLCFIVRPANFVRRTRRSC